jgi:formate dehydrogenase subunit gamma
VNLLRYTLVERIIHWLAAIAYMYVLLTGLAFYSPHLYWIATLLGSGPTSRFWHPWVALLFVAAIAWMLRAWLADMRITAVDRAWGKAMNHYVRNEDEDLPPIDRFNLGQKYFFWAMLWASVALLVSGAVLWFPEKIPWSLRAVRSAAVLVHVASALVTIGAFIIHVYMGTAVVRGGFTSIVRGEVSPAWAKTHHRLWYERTAKRDNLGPAHRAR